MGLFDIFRRKSKQKKEEAPESAASENAESQAAASENTASQSTAAESEVGEGTASQSTVAESEVSESAANQSTAAESEVSESAASQSTAAESEVSEGTAGQSTAIESEAASAANDQKEAAAEIDDATAAAMQESAAAAEEQAAQSDAARQAEQAAIEKAQSEAAKQSAAAAEEQAAQSDAARQAEQAAIEKAQSEAAEQSAAAAEEQAAQVKSAQSQAASEAISGEKTAEQAASQSASVENTSSTVADERATTETVKKAAAAEETVEEPTKAAEPQSATDHDSAAAVQAETEATVEQNDENDENDDEAASESQAEESTTEKYDRGLKKSRTGFGAKLNHFLANFRHVDEDFFEDLEDLLIESDVGYDMAMKISDELREEVKLQNAKSKQDVSNVIIEKMVDLYEDAGKDENPDLNFAKEGPTVIMFVGVNGAGKTTTIGKMAKRFKDEGKRVLLAAGDTFRAGAVEQLDVWAKRDGVDIVMGPANGDPAAVVFDGVKKAKEENYDILLVDTAGRLQNKVNLMNELAKMKRIMAREIPDAPHEVLLVLDATTGQNALNQAKLFKESTDVSGIVLTKLDGTARGGIVLAIRNELHLPVKYVGLGEKVTDLEKFDASDFVYGLFKGLVVEK